MKIMKRIILSVLSFGLGCYCSVKVLLNPTIRELGNARTMSSKHLSMFLLMNRWVFLKQHEKCLDKYFIDNGYYRIAVYGLNYIGNALIEELKGTNIVVEYGIDRSQINREDDLKMVTPEDIFDDVDVIVVTPLNAYEQIADDISKKIYCPIVSIEEIVNYCE